MGTEHLASTGNTPKKWLDSRERLRFRISFVIAQTSYCFCFFFTPIENDWQEQDFTVLAICWYIFNEAWKSNSHILLAVETGSEEITSDYRNFLLTSARGKSNLRFLWGTPALESLPYPWRCTGLESFCDIFI